MTATTTTDGGIGISVQPGEMITPDLLAATLADLSAKLGTCADQATAYAATCKAQMTAIQKTISALAPGKQR